MSTVTRPVSQKKALEVAREHFGAEAFVRYIRSAPIAADRAAYKLLSQEDKKFYNQTKGNPYIAFRCTVGVHKTIAGLCAYNRILGQGDTWQEALFDATRERFHAM